MEPDYQPLPTTPQGEAAALRARVAQLEDENRRLREAKMMWEHARDCVDRVFRKKEDNPDGEIRCDDQRGVMRLRQDSLRYPPEKSSYPAPESLH